MEEKNLAFIPTASTIETGDKRWLIRDLVNCRRMGFKKIDIVDISAIQRELWQPRLEDADILFFCGGNSHHLLYWIKKSGLEEILPTLLKTRIYVGISAGSIVATKSLVLSSKDKIAFAKDIGEFAGELGLGYVNFHVRPHLNNSHFSSVRLPVIEKVARDLGEPVYAIDDDTALSVVNEEVTVVSEGQ